MYMCKDRCKNLSFLFFLGKDYGKGCDYMSNGTYYLMHKDIPVAR